MARRPVRQRAPFTWSPSAHLAVYLPRAAPRRPGPWQLPQVRAQALAALITDLAGVIRAVHGLAASTVGAVGAIMLIWGDRRLEDGPAQVAVLGAGIIGVLTWLVWALWLTRSGWRAIAAARRWQAAPARSHSSGAATASPGPAQVFGAVMVVRLVVIIALLGLGIWYLLAFLTGSGSGIGWGGLLGRVALGAVLTTGPLAALAGAVGMVIALRATPARSAGASSRGFAPLPGPDGGPPGNQGQPGAHLGGEPPSPTPPRGMRQTAWSPEHQPAPAVSVPEHDVEDYDQTRFVTRLGAIPAETATGFAHSERIVVVLDDGRQLPADATTLLGRDPKARAEEHIVALLPLADPAVSKTHLELRLEGASVIAVDRASTNGTTLIGPEGARRDLTAWQETAVVVGSTLLLGGTRVRVLLPQDTR